MLCRILIYIEHNVGFSGRIVNVGRTGAGSHRRKRSSSGREALELFECVMMNFVFLNMPQG